MNETITELAWAQFRQQIEPELAKKRKRFYRTVPGDCHHKAKYEWEPDRDTPSIYDEDEP